MSKWSAPTRYVQMAAECLGGIDDAPDELEGERCLARPWWGNVWLCPPFRRGVIGAFVSKLVAEKQADDISAAIMLTHNSTDTAWWQQAASACDAVCFTRGRIKYVDEDGDACSPTCGDTIFYFGTDVPRFRAVFKEVGSVGLPWRAAA